MAAIRLCLGRKISALVGAVVGVLVLAVPLAADEPAARSPRAAALSAGRGLIVRVPLPIVGAVDTRLKQVVEQVLDELPPDGPRPTVVFEFQGQDGEAGAASEFERSLAVARFLAGERLGRVRTVAWLPHSVQGHAVLAVLACEEIVMHPDAQLGAAGLRERRLDATLRGGYEEIASRRRTVPVAVALGMLDPALAVYRVRTREGEQYLLERELQALNAEIAAGQTETVIQGVDTVFKAGELGLLDGRAMRLTHHFASHTAQDRGQLATALGLPPGALEVDPSLGGGWRPVRIALHGAIDRNAVNRIQRGIQDERQRRQVNFVLLEIASAGGDLVESLRLANYLADLDPSEVRTVAYVPHEARGDAALVALACDHLVMRESAVLGGPGAAALAAEAAADLQAPVERLARAKGRTWSLPLAAVAPQLVVHRYTHATSQEVRYFSPAEREQQPQPDEWLRGSEIPCGEGFAGRRAEELGLARHLVTGDAELRQLYQLDRDPRLLRPNWAHTLIEALADPRWAGVLLFIACFALMTEAMSPGLGVPGFVSAVAFALFFWSQFLQGTAGWLEVTLFVLGISCLALELFVLPGFGVFGIGGAALVMASLVLASQTFVIPQSSQDLAQLPRSLGAIVLGGMGLIAALVIMRRLLPRTRVYHRLVLTPPAGDERADREHRESLVQWVHLVGKRGEALTRLTPAGKARFGDEIVPVLSHTGLIEAGTALRVVEVTGNRVIVEEVA